MTSEKLIDARSLCGKKMKISRFQGTYCGCPVTQDAIKYEDMGIGHNLFEIKNNEPLAERLVQINNVFPELLDHIDKQDAIIETLKEKLIDERWYHNERGRALMDGYGPEYDDREFARKELSEEMPEVFGE